MVVSAVHVWFTRYKVCVGTRPELVGYFYVNSRFIKFCSFSEMAPLHARPCQPFCASFCADFFVRTASKMDFMVLMVCGYHLSVFFCRLPSEIGFYLFISCRCKKLFVVAILLIAAIVLEYSSFCITSNMICVYFDYNTGHCVISSE